MKENERSIGFASYYCNDFLSKIGYLSLIGIIPEYQHRGLGQLLLQYCCESMYKEGMNKIRLEVRNNNIQAQNFYEKNELKRVEDSVGGLHGKKSLENLEIILDF